MPRLESTLLDKFVNGAFAGKRKIGRPLKHNIRHKGSQGWIELVFNPRNRTEQMLSDVVRFIHPYLFFITYRFHVEKAREAGLRVEDVYCNKFHKEPYVMHHVYAQYFHPETLLERVRDVAFYRRTRTIFKGFRVPDWAQSQNKYGWDVDVYSRVAWQNALHDIEAEWTPQAFGGQRQDPNVLQWFRYEQWLGGFGSKLFYNEIPQLSWRRQKGHLLSQDTEQERDRALYSFTHASQDQSLMFGMDTRTPEGQEAFKREYETLCELAPEIVKKEDMVFPHEMPTQLSDEPHFQRVWQHYRDHQFKLRFTEALEAGEINEDDAQKFMGFIGMTQHPTFSLFILIKSGRLSHLESDEGYQATVRVLDKLGLNDVQFTATTSMPAEEQFWQQFDGNFELTVEEMRRELPNFISDPGNLAKVEALLESGEQPTNALKQEETRQIAA